MKTIKRFTIFIIVLILMYIYFNASNSSFSIFITLKKNKSVTLTKINKKEINPKISVTSYQWFKIMKHRFKDLGEEDRPRYSEKTPICNLNISALGPIFVNKTVIKLKWVEEKYSEIRGGFYAPTNCRARHKVAILVPYRDREKNLAVFLNHMHMFLKKQYLEYRIFVIEQFGAENFNKGSLFNVGFLESQRFGTWNCIVCHDVDLLPLDSRILYSCPRAPTHMSPAVESHGYKLKYTQLFGGVTALTPAQFERANGYSNFYWGWGAEDDDMFIRLQARRLPLLRYNLSIARYAALPHKKNHRNKLRHYFLGFAKKRYKKEGLSTVRYKLINATKKKLFTHIIADVNLE